jgi:dTDP-4-amino-4,6-dideoxygalactose transaminase
VGVLSFGGSKSLTAGRGGALLTSDAQMHQRAKVYAERGNEAFPLSQLQAAVLLPQLRRLAERNARRRESVLRLWQQTADLPALKPLPAHRPGDLPAYYKLAWQYLPQRAGGRSIDDLVAALQAESVPIDRGFRGFAGRSERRCRKSGSLAESVRAAETTLLLHHPILLEPDAVIDLVAQAMAKVLHAFCRHEKPAKLAGDGSA